MKSCKWKLSYFTAWSRRPRSRFHHATEFVERISRMFSHLLLPSVLLHSRGVGRRGSFAITLPCHCILRTNLLLSRSCSSHPRQFSRGFPAGGRLPQILHGQIWPCDLTSLRGTWSEAALTRLTTGAAADRVSASPGRAASLLSLPFVKLIVFILFGALASLRRRLTVGCSPLRCYTSHGRTSPVISSSLHSFSFFLFFFPPWGETCSRGQSGSFLLECPSTSADFELNLTFPSICWFFSDDFY